MAAEPCLRVLGAEAIMRRQQFYNISDYAILEDFI